MRQPVWFACGDTGLLLDFSGYGPGLGQVATPATDRVNLTRKARQLSQMMRKKADGGAFLGLAGYSQDQAGGDEALRTKALLFGRQVHG